MVHTLTPGLTGLAQINGRDELSIKNKVKFGKNVLIGENVKIGTNCLIGHNSIIEKNVNIGDNCSIGSNVIIRNSFIKNNVHILDGCVIGKKGFGFFPNKDSNFRYPQVGIVIIEDNVEIGCGSTIDRGSLSNTIIGKNTYLDCLLYTSPSPRDATLSRMPSSA